MYTSGVFLALHFWTWFESLQHTSVASSTTIVCTEVIWVSLGYWLFMKGKLPARAIGAIAVTLMGSVMITFADSKAQGSHLYGDLLALLAAVAVSYMLSGYYGLYSAQRIMYSKTNTSFVNVKTH